ncbi:MAG: helix-turn-helix transcriptional regulator [Ruminococcus sp.]|nr:helix-turn-helix transcriptional regulator [Ruminococcus sp.]
MMTMGQKIRNKRLERDLTQGELAQLSGVSKSMICYLEKDLRVPTSDKLKRIAKVLRCSMDYICNDKAG